MLLGLLNAVRPFTPPAHADEATTDGEFVPLWTAPLLETKTGIGTPNGQAQKVPANGAMTFQALDQGGLPASGVSAASLKVHAITPTSTGFLSVYPSNKPTTISTVSFTNGESSTNADFAQITTTGQITVANNSNQPVDVLIAVDGYFKSGGAATTVYKPLTTKVLWDTRTEFATGSPTRTTPLDPWSSIEVQTAGQVGIPTQCDQSAAVALNIVALNQTNNGELKIEPTDSPIGVGTLQFTANDWNNSTFSIVQMSCSGKLRVTNSSPGTVNVSISVRGYFTYWDADDRGARYKPTEPATILDTTTGTGTGGATTPMNGESHLVFDATGPSGVPANTVSAVAMQIKVINPTAGGWITFRPEDQPEIPISSMVYQAGENASGFETQIPSGLGRIAITNHGNATIHVQITARGYYIHKTIEVIEGDIPDPPSISYRVQAGVEVVSSRAEDGLDAAPASYDPVTNTVIATATTEAALAVASAPVEVPIAEPEFAVADPSNDPPAVLEEEELPEVSQPEQQMMTITPRPVLVPNTSLDLDTIKDQILSLDPAEVAGADQIVAAWTQRESNRVIVDATSAPAALQEYLTSQYGPSRVAIHVDPDPLTFTDDAAVYGGAFIKDTWNNGRCSSGFGWRNSRGTYVVTAGHCGDPNDGGGGGLWFNKNNKFIGIINWSNYSNGSPVKRPSSHGLPPRKTRYSGDASFIATQPNSDGIPRPSIYIGPIENRKKVRVIGSAHNDRADVGEFVCVSGSVTGESCGYKIASEAKDFHGKKEVVLAKSTKGGCTRKGDSGGPVYSKNSRGVWARGIIKGHATQRGVCFVAFTDIADVRWLGGGYPMITTPS